jgi:hypothetical protein
VETCESVACGLADFNCDAPDCIAGCPDGYCTPEEVSSGFELEPPIGGDYALVLSYRYGPEGTPDRGIVCYRVEVDADGTQSMTLADGEDTCCMQP